MVGASAGGVEALKGLASALPADLPAAVFVVLHVPADGRSVLPSILARAGRLPAVHPPDGAPIETGRIYVAPPDRHLLVGPGHVRLTRGPRENGHRPAVDVLFRTAALAYGPRVVGVVLSGALDDGTAGMAAVKERGGLCVAQHPDDAIYSSMPASAIEHTPMDYIEPVAEIGPLLDRLAREQLRDEQGRAPIPAMLEAEVEAAEMDEAALDSAERPGTPAGFGCPDCGGALWDVSLEDLIRFRCRVGHAWGVDSLLAAQGNALEAALWTALRALEERAALSDRLTTRAHARGHAQTARRFADEARDSRRRARLIARVLQTEDFREKGLADRDEEADERSGPAL